jgi:acyl carrier protein
MQQERDAQSEDPPAQPVEAVVAALVAELAERPGEPPSPEMHLSEAGFDSLLCAELALAVEERFGVRLADTEVGALRTVGEVAEHVRRRLPSRPRLPDDLGKYQRLVRRLDPAFAPAPRDLRRDAPSWQSLPVRSDIPGLCFATGSASVSRCPAALSVNLIEQVSGLFSRRPEPSLELELGYLDSVAHFIERAVDEAQLIPGQDHRCA